MMRALTIKHITKNVLGYSLFIFIVFEYSIIHHNYAFGSQKRVASGLADAAFNSGVLPDNFVSIHIKDAGNKTTSHHVGGIMIHPGVILTAWGTAWGVGYSLDEKYRPIKVKRGYTVYSENELEIVFNLKQGGNKADKKIHFEVKKIINHTSYFDHEPIFHTIALLFFEPNESIAHISSLPLVTTKDFKSYEDLIDTDVWAVGIPHKVQADDQPLVFEDHQQPPCTSQTDWKIGRINLDMTPLEYQLILDMRELYSQKTDKQSSKENISLFYCTHSSDQAYFCTEPRASSNSKLGIAYQCPQHIGYPVMWQSKQGALKVLGLTTSSPFMKQVYSHFSAEMKKEYHIDKKELAHSLLSLQYNLIDSHRWIKASLIDYEDNQKHTSQPFKLDHAIIESWDFSLEEKKNASKGYPFMVVLRYKLDDNDGLVFSCRGTIIQKGVILTAAHCLEYYMSEAISSKPPLYASFQAGGKEYVVTINKVEVFPEYVSALTGENQPHYQHDLALMFYQHHEKLPEIAPLPLNRQLDLFDHSKTPTQFVMISSHTTEGFLSARKRDKQYSQVPVEIINTEEDYIDYLYSVYPLLKARSKKILAKTQETLKEDLMSEDLSVYVKKIATYQKWREKYSGINGYKSIIALPAHSVSFLERGSVSCHGDSGSPVIYDHNGTLSLVGVNSQFMSAGNFKLLCNGNVGDFSVPIKPYLHWIAKTIKEVTLLGLHTKGLETQ